jgi:hypothetical protein
VNAIFFSFLQMASFEFLNVSVRFNASHPGLNRYKVDLQGIIHV